jgi:hypothetical protein
MKSGKPTILALSLSIAGAATASAAPVSGPTALALAAVVAPSSPLLSPGEKHAVAALFAGHTAIPYAKKIAVIADKIVCRTSNVDIAARSCQLTFKTGTRSLTGREANEVFATLATAGVQAEGAAGSNIESLSKLNCTLDPNAIRQKDGSGAECAFDGGN